MPSPVSVSEVSRSVMSDSLWPHALQHESLPCASSTPRACPNSRPLSRWCHPTTLSSVTPFSSCLHSFPASGSFPRSQFFASGSLRFGVSASAPKYWSFFSCLTTSNLPWFMDLIFQVPMQYGSFQQWTLLPSPVTSTSRRCFRFGSVSSFFLHLFLHSYPVAYGAPTDLGSSSFSVLSFCLFPGVHEPCHVGQAKMNRSWWEFWQNVVPWRREWQTTPAFLPWEPHEHHTWVYNPQ